MANVSDVSSTIGRNIKAALKDSKMSQAAFAENVLLMSSTRFNLMLNGHSEITLVDINLICEELKLTFEQLSSADFLPKSPNACIGLSRYLDNCGEYRKCSPQLDGNYSFIYNSTNPTENNTAVLGDMLFTHGNGLCEATLVIKTVFDAENGIYIHGGDKPELCKKYFGFGVISASCYFFTLFRQDKGKPDSVALAFKQWEGETAGLPSDYYVATMTTVSAGACKIPVITRCLITKKDANELPAKDVLRILEALRCEDATSEISEVLL